MNSSTNALLGKRAICHIFATDYIDWAEEMLIQGYDTPNLRILAGLDRKNSIFAVEQYFHTAIKELNIEEIEPNTAVRIYACEVAKQIINGEIKSSQQAIEALYQIYVGTDYDSDYMIWSELDDAFASIRAGEYPYTYPSATLENFAAILKQEATKFITSMAT
jgi:hypothetical protein